jgi:hypothetical protein
MTRKTTNRLLAACVSGLLLLGGSGVAGAAPQKLNKRDAETVQRADGQCEEVAKALAEIGKTKEAIETSDASSIPEETIRDLKDQIKFANNKLDAAERTIRFLPADHPEVVAQAEKIAGQRAALAAATEAIDGFNKRLEKALAVGEGPGAKSDIENVKAMSKAYTPFQLAQDPKVTAELAARVAADVQTLIALREKFKPLVQRGTPEGKEYKYWAESAESHVGQFRYKCQIYTEKGADVIPAAIANAVTAAEQAAAQKKPDFFTGGVADQLDMARRNVQVYAAVVGADDPMTVKLQAALAAGEKRIEALRSTLREEILASMKTPPDAYKGADKAQLKALVEKEWKAVYPKDEVLAVRFVAPEWKHKTGATWSAAWKSWEDYDYSDMQVRVIVKTDKKLATVYWVYLTKDHMAKDRIKVDARTKGGGSDEMLLANVEFSE